MDAASTFLILLKSLKALAAFAAIALATYVPAGIARATPQSDVSEDENLPSTLWRDSHDSAERRFLQRLETDDVLRQFLVLHQPDSVNSDSTDFDFDSTSSEPEDSTAQNGRGQRRSSQFDEATIRQGQQFFESSCTACHDAERSLSKRKTYAGWLATVRRMAAQDDAFIPSNEHVPIATYLASLNPELQRDPDDNGIDMQAAAEEFIPPYTLNGTISSVWRGTDPEVENKGFFPDVWVAAGWRTEDSPISGRVEACTSCHGTNQGLGVELVEASVTLDLIHFFTRCSESERCPGGLQAELKAGRFIVPFGAFSGRVHPGALRTASLPLMYNMGRRVGPISIHQPVLPLPFSDEGFNLRLRQPLSSDEEWVATLDVYGVNGLQTGGPGVFFASRSYRDNNSNVAVGGRATVGTQRLRIGGSISSGELQTEAAGVVVRNYKLAGGDITFRWNETVRAYYEYAIRKEVPPPGGRNLAYGHLTEVEFLLLSDPNISLLARYDTLENQGAFGDQFIERYTWGFNFALYGGSTLILDHEHWKFETQPPIDILGMRWTMAF